MIYLIFMVSNGYLTKTKIQKSDTVMEQVLDFRLARFDTIKGLGSLRPVFVLMFW